MIGKIWLYSNNKNKQFMISSVALKDNWICFKTETYDWTTYYRNTDHSYPVIQIGYPMTFNLWMKYIYSTLH